MRIFIDVDDTLVLWPSLSAGDYPLKLNAMPRPNAALVEALQRMCGAVEIIVWTTTNARYPDVEERTNTYAHTWAEKFLSAYGVNYRCAIDKHFALLQDGDIAVDDTPIIGYLGKWMTANEFICFAEDWRREWDASHAHATHGGGH